MNRYVSIVKANFMSLASYPMSLFFTLIGNLVYITVVYFLWKQIYNGQETLRGMTFNQVFVYLTLAGSILILFRTWTDWHIARQITDGSIAMSLVKPLDYQWQEMAGALGMVLFNGVIITLPSIIVVLFIFHAQIPLGINLLFLVPSIVCAYILSFCFDYLTGLITFYTQSIWGISITKDVIVAVLSGALVPLQFFPEGLQNILKLLPCQAMYNIPLQITTSNTLQVSDYIQMLTVQLLWVLVFLVASRLFFRRVMNVLMINGG